ncbi:ABC transporter permease [Phenylobacterium deserti]|uniref:ABC transporter permease n=1 Tax=Phenylobacterium deserti TaxID=1914756 RepID=A0A328AYR7_9CAUL|nr:ABC transporter permease [Phenylobacterium deserti]RAK57958.1 ABC transporter permease [Phenylobacterium deserti]
MNAHSLAHAVPLTPAPPQVLLPEPVLAVADRPAAPRRLGLGVADPLGWLLGPALLLFAWTLGSFFGLIDPRVLPAPWTAAETSVDLIREGRLQQNLAISAWRVAQGLAFGVSAGLLVALLAGLSLIGGYLFDGLVQVKRAIPTLALIPLVVIWFGIGETMKITVISLAVFVPIYLNTHTALRGIESRYVELAETVGLSRLDFIRHVVLPGALPGFMLGLRFGVMSGWLALVVVEQLNATSGIGYMINLARVYAQTDVIVVGILVYALLGLASDMAVRAAERRLVAWRRTFGK